MRINGIYILDTFSMNPFMRYVFVMMKQRKRKKRKEMKVEVGVACADERSRRVSEFCVILRT